MLPPGSEPSLRAEAEPPGGPARGPVMIGDLDALLIALYMELTDRIIPPRSRAGSP